MFDFPSVPEEIRYILITNIKRFVNDLSPLVNQELEIELNGKLHRTLRVK